MSTLIISEARASNYGSKRRHWSICRDGLHIANLGKGSEAWARWSVLPIDEANGKTADGYATFSNKAAALAYAETL